MPEEGAAVKRRPLTKEALLRGEVDTDNVDSAEMTMVLNSMSQEEQQAFMMMQAAKPVQKLVLKVVRPDQSEEAAAERDDLYIVKVHPSMSSINLKRKLCKEFEMDPMDLVVHYQNTSGWGSKKPELLTDDYSLSDQAVRTGALIICKRNAYNPVVSKNASSAYYINEHKQIPDDQRYAPGGAPVKIDSSDTGKENVANKTGGYADVSVVCPCVKIAHWAFADEGKNVKIYIDADKEPEVVKAAESSAKGAVEADFSDRGFRLVVQGNGKKHLLDFDDLEDEIVPSECKTRVSAGKRLTVTLRKKDVANTWYTLIRHK